MNLWVKRTGQFLIAALFLISCEDETFLLGFKNQNKKFGIRYQELSLSSSVLLIDSAITDNTRTPSRFLVGSYYDNAFGMVSSEAFTEFFPISDTLLDAGNATFDSIIVQLRFDRYVYGSSGNTTEMLSLHELSENLNEDLLIDTLNFHYYYNSNVTYNASQICTASQVVSYDSLKEATSQDTLLFKFKIENTNSFGTRLFYFVRDNNFADDSTYYAEFRKEFKGLAFVPSPTNNKVIGFNPFDALSRIYIHYHTPSDTLKHSLAFGSISFNRISTDRSSTDLSGLQSYQEFDLTSLRYIQSGSPVITKIDLSDYYSFVDTIPNLAINSAELVLTPIGVAEGLEPPSSLLIRLQNENNQFLNYTITEDRESLTGYEMLYLDGKYFAAGSDLNIGTATAPVTLTYNEDENKFSGFITLFLQDLFKNRNKEVGERILSISINPSSPTLGKSVNRLVFDESSLKLKIHYTKPINSNLE